MDVNFEEDQQWEEEAVVIAKRVEEEYQKEKMRSDQMQQNEDVSTVRKSKRISKNFLRILQVLQVLLPVLQLCRIPGSL